MTIITPEELEADAVIPQCLDNQYISDRVFKYMVDNGYGYDNPTVQAMREQEMRTEFIRSLIYSSQVVINRAFMKNNNNLYKYFHPSYSVGRRNIDTFAELMRQKIIVPYLFRESSLGDNLDLDVTQEGDHAIRMLLQETGDNINCVRLAADNSSNENQTELLSESFFNGMTRLRKIRGQRLHNMASELFHHEPGLIAEDGRLEALKESLVNLARYSFDRGETLTRTDIYKDWFIVEGGNEDDLTLGHFRTPEGSNQLVMELKKLVDLQYNSNLPDLLKRYTFTPATLPSRVALQDIGALDRDRARLDKSISPDVVEDIRRLFMARTGEAMSLPVLSNLQMGDIFEIRRLPEWETFKNNQKEILRCPLKCLDLFEQFQESFDAFQRAMSYWYQENYGRQATEGSYLNFVTLALVIGGQTFAIAMDSNFGINVLSKIALNLGSIVVPKVFGGYAVRLMINVFDLEKQKLDTDRSYSLELMNYAQELTQQDVSDLMHQISTEKDGISEPYIGSDFAEQGKQ